MDALFTVGDLWIIAIYFVISLGVGLLLSRRASGSLENYFLSGRSGSWWLVGTGMVATTFGADTPLWVAGQVAQLGVSGNWLWWSAAAGGTLTVFFFARLWRRAGVLTDLEFIELRYGGWPASALRGFKAVYFGIFMNCIVLGWVNLAMLKIMRVIFPEIESPEWLVIGVALITLLYVAAAGLRGVMIADAFQFFVALVGCILLAVYAVRHPAVVAAGGLVGGLPPGMLGFLPNFELASAAPGDADETGGAGRIALSAFCAYLFVQWWASWYPGQEPGGGGYIAQRIMSAKDERSGVLATLWFVIAHYCVRSWPWIIAGLAAVIIYPGLSDAERESGFVYLMRDVLPAPLRGLLCAAFLGAYMSTLSTHLNWGGSYVINDFYKRFLKPGESEAHYVFMSRWLTVLLAVVSLFVSFVLLDSIRDTWNFLLSITAGMGLILILRWYWWRVNAAAEIASMLAPLAAFAIFGLVRILIPGINLPEAPEDLFLIVPISLACTLLVMYCTPAESTERLRAFYERVRPAGPGWRPINQGQSAGQLRWLFVGWLAATVLVYCVLFAIGALLFARYALAVGLIIGSLVSWLLVRWTLIREFHPR